MGLAIQMLLLSVLTNTVSQLCLKHGLKSFSAVNSGRCAAEWPIRCRLLRNPFVLLWAALLVPSMFLWLKVISIVELSVAYPFMSLTPVFICVGSVLFLRERVMAKQWVGVVLIVFGIMLVSTS
jgi:drug/metabolite transporter (DMT)-like permease